MLWDNIRQFFASIKDVLSIQFSSFGVMDAIDMLVVAYLVYMVIRFIRETRAMQLVKGIVLLFILMQVSEWLNMNTVNYILVNSLQLGLIVIIIIFQPELRRALEQVGRTKFGSKLFLPDEIGTEKVDALINSVCSACEYLSRNKIGALLVFERDTMLGDIIKTGTVLNADCTGELLVSIFFPNTPLHDGAVVIRYGKVKAAGCFLPLTQKADVDKEMGTRHRAAIGMTENSDAFVVVVSEETGKITTVENGAYRRDVRLDGLRAEMEEKFKSEENKKTGLFGFFRRKGADSK